MTFSKKSVLSVSLFVLILWGAVLSTFANPPTSPYGVSQNITDPACPPGGTNCYVASVSIGDTIGNNPDQNGILYTDASGQITTDDLFTRDSVTKETNIFRDASVNIQTDEYVVNAYPILLVQVSGPGSFTVGETITGQNSGATAVVGGYVLGGSGNLLYVSNISGTFIEGEEITSTYPGTVMVDEEILPSSFAVGDAFMEFEIQSGPTGVTGSVTAVSGDSITVNVTGGSLTPSNILFNTTQNNNYRGIVSAQPVTVSGTAHTGFTLSNIAIGTPFSGSGMYSELNGNKLFAGIVNGYQFGIFSEISGTPSGYYLPTTAGTTGQALISLGGNTVGWGTLPSAISVNNDGTLYSGTLGAGEGDRDNIFLGSYAGYGATNASNSNFFGQSAGNGATNASNSNFLGSYAGFGAASASNSNFLGSFAGNGATNAYQSNFLGYYSGSGATNASNSNFLGYYAGNNATNASGSNFLGSYAGFDAASASNSNFLGYYAGNNATNASGSNFLGYYAGNNATNASDSNFLGSYAGFGAASASNSNFLGSFAGYSATSASYSNFLGYYAGINATNASNSNFLGYYAGNNATNASGSNFLGNSAGYTAINAEGSNFFGNNAGYNATYGSYSNFFGHYAGQGATIASSSNFFGAFAGQSATNAYFSNFFGEHAGHNATDASNSNFFGYLAGLNATSASNSIFIGKSAGNNDLVNNTGSPNDFSILIGPNTSTGNNGSGVGYSNSIALGGYATNTASNQFMIGSTTRPIDTTIWKGSASTECTLTTGTGISCTSDERLKTNIIGLTTDTLDKVLNIKTVTYNWLENPDSPTQIGFLAQDLEQYFPELVATNTEGKKSVFYAQMAPILVEAIREMDLKITTINDMATPNTWRDSLIAWFGNVENGITEFFAKRVTTDELCVGTVCVTQDQFLQMVQQSGQIPVVQTPSPDPQPADTPTEDTSSDQSVTDTVSPSDTPASTENTDIETSDTPPSDSSSDTPSDSGMDTDSGL